MLILIYSAYILHFAQNNTVLKLSQFIYGISSDGHCCQQSIIAINRPSKKCCRHMIKISQWQASLQLSVLLS